MSKYHASGRPRFHTGSIVEVHEVRVTPRSKVSAASYRVTDRNGMSVGITRDVLRGQSRSPVRTESRPTDKPRVRVLGVDRNARERQLTKADLTWLASE